MDKERRNYYRLPKQTEVVCKKIDFSEVQPEYNVESKNISAKGLLLLSPHSYNLGDIMRVSIALPRVHKFKPGYHKPMMNPYEEPITTIGKVVRIEQVDDEQFEIGLCFEGMYEDDYIGLLNYIENIKES